MVKVHSNDLLSGQRGRFIYITGCDGTGKSTQAERMINRLQAKGDEVCHLWLRFPFFLSVPFLMYARWRGLSWYEVTDGVRHGYWDFKQSWLMSQVFPWVFWLDTAVATWFNVYYPLWRGKTIVCERFVLDMLVDLSLGCSQDLFTKPVGQAFRRLLPSEATVLLLDLDVETACQRRPALQYDWRLTDRLAAFRTMAHQLEIPLVSTQDGAIEVSQKLYAKVWGINE